MNNHLLIPNFERGAFVVFAFQFNTSRKFKVFHFLFFAITFQKGTKERKKERNAFPAKGFSLIVPLQSIFTSHQLLTTKCCYPKLKVPSNDLGRSLVVGEEGSASAHPLKQVKNLSRVI